MTKILLAVAAAFAFSVAAPAFACPDCKDCPMHKNKVAAADTKAEKKDAKDVKVADCKCAKDAAGACKCGEKCECPHCHGAKTAEKKDETKKS
jgi:hypothetical protein